MPLEQWRQWSADEVADATYGGEVPYSPEQIAWAMEHGDEYCVRQARLSELTQALRQKLTAAQRYRIQQEYKAVLNRRNELLREFETLPGFDDGV